MAECRSALVHFEGLKSIRRHAANRRVNLIQQRRDLGGIVAILIREGLRHNHAAVSIDAQMQLAPLPA